MPKLSTILWSSVGKKFFMALTGLMWVGFSVGHLTGNLMLYSSNPDPFNKYSHFLINLGTALYVIEAFLVFTLLYHAISGIAVWLGKQKARPVAYAKSGNAGGNSRKTISSITMIYSGVILMSFVVMHVWTFKYGPWYTTMIDGEEARDLYRLVYESFGQAWYTGLYVAAMITLWSHLRHGFWSAFQSLGVSHPRYSPVINAFGTLISLVLAAGFIAIPLYIFFTGGA